MDFDNFNQPIQKFIEDRVYFALEMYTKKGADIFIKKA